MSNVTIKIFWRETGLSNGQITTIHPFRDAQELMLNIFTDQNGHFQVKVPLLEAINCFAVAAELLHINVAGPFAEAVAEPLQILLLAFTDEALTINPVQGFGGTLSIIMLTVNEEVQCEESVVVAVTV